MLEGRALFSTPRFISFLVSAFLLEWTFCHLHPFWFDRFYYLCIYLCRLIFLIRTHISVSYLYFIFFKTWHISTCNIPSVDKFRSHVLIKCICTILPLGENKTKQNSIFEALQDFCHFESKTVILLSKCQVTPGYIWGSGQNYYKSIHSFSLLISKNLPLKSHENDTVVFRFTHPFWIVKVVLKKTSGILVFSFCHGVLSRTTWVAIQQNDLELSLSKCIYSSILKTGHRGAGELFQGSMSPWSSHHSDIDPTCHCHGCLAAGSAWILDL